MTKCRIFKPTKTAMQSGRANTKAWVLAFEPESRNEPDPLMGWISSSDMRGQVQLGFATKEEAVAYAEKQGFGHVVETPKERRVRPKSYAENFKFRRVV